MRYDGPFMRLWEQVLGYIYLTLVWLVFCIPLVTIGAATSAFYGTARRYLMAREGHLLPTFWRVFRSSFRQSTVLWVASVAVGFLIFQGIRIMQVWSTAAWSGAFQGVQILCLVFLLAVLIYGLPSIARFDNRLVQIVKNSLILSIRHFGKTLLILLLIAIGVFICWLLPIFLIIVPSLVMLFWCHIVEKIFGLYLPEPDSDRGDPEEDAEGRSQAPRP